ncbi:MAG: HDIG domain-containing protein [Desulfobacterota bacterium]|nr:HDIG domain-containing protein [Thermodesulfobacteriota bacterium]
MIPTREDCLRLMVERGMLGNIFDHSLVVARVALFLSVRLNRKGQRLDLSLVEAAALLHDLTKTECLRTKEDHALTGSRVLKEMGYHRLGEVVAAHIHLSKPMDPYRVSEEEVVNYADKRVRHDQIVSLEERFEDLKGRYGMNERAIELLDALKEATFAVERKIFSFLEMDPDRLEAYLCEEQ